MGVWISSRTDWRDASKSIFKRKIRGFLFDTLLDRDDYVEVDTLVQRQHPGSSKEMLGIYLKLLKFNNSWLLIGLCRVPNFVLYGCVPLR